jgi:hypothetical protein
MEIDCMCGARDRTFVGGGMEIDCMCGASEDTFLGGGNERKVYTVFLRRNRLKGAE